MEELKEIRINDNRILLNNNLVRSDVLPKVTSELKRDVVVQGESVVEGAIYAQNLQIKNGPFEVQGAVFTNLELHIENTAKGKVTFRKAVGSADSVVSLAPGCRAVFMSDINAKTVKLRNAYVAGNIFAEDIELEDSVVIGGAFAANDLDITNCILGTFNCSSARIAKSASFLLPSVFTIEPVTMIPGTEIYNLSLADLGALYKGTPEEPNSGKIRMSLQSDEMKTVLTSGEGNQVVRSLSVVGKVLAADLLDPDKLNNHFLITAASLGNQLLKTYDLGLDANNAPIELTTEKITDFFFDLLHGRKSAKLMEGSFSMQEIIDNVS